MEKNELKRGDVIKYDNAIPGLEAYQVIAIVGDGLSLSAALNRRGFDYEQDRIWDNGNMPPSAINIALANEEDKAKILRCMVDHYNIVISKGRIFVTNEKQMSQIAKVMNFEYTPKKELDLADCKFKWYLCELVDRYNKNNTLKGMEDIRKKHGCKGITIDQFYKAGLFRLKPRDITDELVEELNNTYFRKRRKK